MCSNAAVTFVGCSFQDCFFYSLVFDPLQKTLLADQGEIRVGSKYQAEIPDKLAEGGLAKQDRNVQTNGSEFNCFFSSFQHYNW